MALGQEENTNGINDPGLYRDPQSGAELEVTMHAGADALVRMGWQRVADGELEAQSTSDVAPGAGDASAPKRLTRKELEEKALALGIENPKDAPNIAALQEAIDATEAEAQA